ncbi:hypothetical protein HYW44_01535 [Candidatus Daviesbacteria bacterium]|nr:hypothetical protein [Candidatus Daviesbacteria bacterium]
MQEIVPLFQNKKNLISLVVLLALILAVPLGIYLARNAQIFRPKADITGAVALGQGDCVTTLNGEKVLTCKDVPLILTAPFESPNPTASASAAASISPSPSSTASSSASPSVGANISISEKGKFVPGKVKIKKGSLVTFVNNHVASHTLTSHENLFDPQRLNQGDQFSFVFSTNGKYKVEIEDSKSTVNVEVKDK